MELSFFATASATSRGRVSRALDYAPQVGRWTNKDPRGFTAGRTNLKVHRLLPKGKLSAHSLNNPRNFAAKDRHQRRWGVVMMFF